MNRAKIFLILMFLLITYQANAQQYGWRVFATPRPGYQMKAVEFKDSLHGWCDAGGLMFRTTDGGHSWDTCGQPYLTNGVLDISFSDTLHGWAVATVFGDEALIWRTTNGGVTWIQQRHDYVRDYNGTAAQSILKNTTSGNTHFSAVRDTGKIVETPNGGQMWTERTLADSITYFGQIQFIDSLHGWIYAAYISRTGGPNGRGLLQTSDGGNSWRFLEGRIGYYCFADTANGFAYGGRNFESQNNGIYVLRTRNSGLTWDSTFVPDSNVYNDQISPRAVSFIDTLNGWMFCNTVYQGDFSVIIIRTSDGGISWKAESIGLARTVGDGIMIDTHHGWVVTLDGNVLGYELITSVVEHLPELPTGFLLRQNYPNPFNNSTVIEYEIPTASDVLVQIYDEIGKRVTTLVDQYQQAGVYRFQFDATGLSSGVYFYSMQAASYRNTKQLMLVK